MAVTTYSGSVTPLRGLGAFTEAERDVFWGRETQTEELARLVTSDGYRAGLLHGAIGVGKTSLLHAGLVPHLRDHGVVALLCRNNNQPATALAREFTSATNKAPRENEGPVAFLARTVSEALRGQQYLFIIDDIGSSLASRDETVIGELADVFARVVTRSGGRARVLFCCESSELHQFGFLERRTGSLFPPSSRVALEAFSADQAAEVFERMGSISGFATDPQITSYVAKGLNHGGPVTAAALQIAVLAMRDLGATNAAAIDALGGPAELAGAWITSAAGRTDDKRASLRLLAQLAQGKGNASLTCEWIASRSNIEGGFASTALDVLRDHGVLRAEADDDGNIRYHLGHQVLAPKIRMLAAPAQAAARRAFELLGSKAENRRRLTLREWYELKRERITPSSPDERAVVERTKRFATIAAGLAVAIPVLLLIFIYIAMSGRYYFDAKRVDGADRVVVRDGRPGLSMFNWLGFGDVVADTGFDRRMVGADQWSDIKDEDLTFDGDQLADKTLSIVEPKRGALIRYAIDGNEAALDVIFSTTEKSIELAETLDKLALIGRGGAKEVELVEAALGDGSAAVRISALRLAAAVEARRPGSYRDQLAAALASKQSQERRLAASVVRGLPDKLARPLWSAALARATDAEAKAELGARAITGATSSANPSRLAALISNPGTDATNRATARSSLERLVAVKPMEAVPALRDVAVDEAAPEDDRVWALGALFEHTVVESEGDLKSKLGVLAADKSQKVKAAALPLLARLDPTTTAAELAILLESKAAPTALRSASALAWGEVAASDRVAAEAALEKLSADRKSSVRAAAARALGKLGRASQSRLVELIKKEGLEVGTGAAFGLVESVRAGARPSSAVGGIAVLWKKKGRAKRRATQAFAALARIKPNSAASYLASAATDGDDSGLRSIGVEGLCNALSAGGRRATSDLLSVAGKVESTELRRRIAECAADHRETRPAAAIRLAEKLLTDRDSTVRLEAVQILAALASDDDAKEAVAPKLGVALSDPSRAVRIIAAEAIAVLGDAAPVKIADRLPATFSRAEEVEKLALLAAARAIRFTGLVPAALADPSDRVRMAGLALALRSSSDAEPALQSALTDPSSAVRRAALEALASSGEGLRSDIALRALGLATRDSSQETADRAIVLLARVGDPQTVADRLASMLASRTDATRRAAASAAQGLAEQDPERAKTLLEPALRDPARDVRAAAAVSLGFALAASSGSLDELKKGLTGAERRPATRLAFAAALALKANNNRDGALAALKEVAESGPQLAQVSARVAHGLVNSDSDALGFLAYLAP